MNWSSYVLCGFVATVVLTTLLAGSQASGMTRINVPYLLGTMVTSNRDGPKLMGVFLHFINGWLFAVFVHLCRRLPGNREIDMVVRCSHRFSAGTFRSDHAAADFASPASAHGKRATRPDGR